VIEALEHDGNHQEEMIDPLLVMVATIAAVGIDDVTNLVIVNILVEDEAVVLLIVTIAVREGTVKSQKLNTPTIADVEVLVTVDEEEEGVTRKI